MPPATAARTDTSASPRMPTPMRCRVEVRYGGVDVLADPGTYCYHGEPAWRSYFRSTIAHNTARARTAGTSPARAAPSCGCGTRTAGKSASRTPAKPPSGPPTTTATCRCARRPGTAARSGWTAPRAVSDIVDEIDGGGHDVRLAFHLGPDVQAELNGSRAVLRWPTAATPGQARLELPPRLQWSLHRGETDPILGWYSPGLGHRVPAFTLLGCGRCTPGVAFTTRLDFLDADKTEKHILYRLCCITAPRPFSRERDTEEPSGGRMSGQALDLKRSAQIMRRYKILIGVAAVVGLLAGAAYGFLNPPMLSSSALIVLPVSTRGISTEVVIAHSDPVLSAALPQAGIRDLARHPAHPRQDQQPDRQRHSRSRPRARRRPRRKRPRTPSPPVSSAISVSGNSAVGTLQAKLVAPAANATGSSLFSDLALAGVFGAAARRTGRGRHGARAGPR